MVDAICKLNAEVDPVTALPELAQYVNDNLGKGGWPDTYKIQKYLGHINTSVQGPGYFMVRIDDAYGVALEYLRDNGGHPLIETLEVLWPTDEAGEPIVYDPIMYDVELTDENGVVTVEQRQIGRI